MHVSSRVFNSSISIAKEYHKLNIIALGIILFVHWSNIFLLLRLFTRFVKNWCATLRAAFFCVTSHGDIVLYDF